MDKKLYIGLALAALISFPSGRDGVGLVAAEAPLDDAYYWPEPIEQTTPTIPTTPTAPADTVTHNPSPVIEFTNIQDTTVTVKIRR